MAKNLAALALLLAALCLAPPLSPARAAEAPGASQVGYIMVPAYSHILIGDNARPFYLAITLCLRNASQEGTLSILAVDYHDDNGQLIKSYLDKPVVLKGLGSLVFTVAEADRKGGVGAKFLVKWRSDRPVPPPLAEAVMIGTSGQQGISFTSRGENVPGRP